MNKLLSCLVNDEKIQKMVLVGGVALSAIANTAVFVGVYYLALHKGVELRDAYYYENEVKEYEERKNNE